MEASRGQALVEWERIRQYFQHAVELEPAEREIYLQSACGDDVLLRAEVRALLAEHDRASGLLATGPNPFHSDQFILSPGDCLGGRFEIIRPLGAGGMGEVYEALDRELGERVALKALRPDLIHDRKNRERFKNEILNGRKVTHPNICRIYDLAPDYESDRACLAFTMELLDGETLAAHLERQPGKRLSVEEVLPLVHQMADGLEALHQQGIVHRDFKPGNVILVRQGESTQVRITDFGLAWRTEAPGPALSGSTDIIGTPIYMAPEQLTGDRSKVSAATDVYALGLVLYEMVTGVRAFSAETLWENIQQKTTKRPSSLRQRVPGIDQNWETTILRCLEREPGDRPSTPAKVVAALEGTVRLREPHRRPRAFVALLALLLALAIGVLRFPYSESAVPPSEQPGATQAQYRQVAVLPFTAVGGDPELQVLADGLMETITQRLSQFEGLNEELVVVSARDVRREGVQAPAEALKKFGVNYAVEGALQLQGDRLQLVLTVIDAERSQQLETAVIEGRRSSALSLQDGAVTKLSNLLNLRIEPGQIDYQSEIPIAPGAQEFYLQAKGYLQRSDRRENIDTAVLQFKRALEADGEFALSYAGLGEAYWRLYERTSDPKWVEEALESCWAAQRLNDQNSEVQIALGRVYAGIGRYDDAVARFQAALEFDRRSGEAFEGLAHAYARLGQTDLAQVTYHKAVSMRPGDWRAYFQLGRFYFGTQRFEQAIEPFRRVTMLTPDNAQGYLNLGAALHSAGRLEEARTMYDRSIKIEPKPVAFSNVGKLLYDQGRYEEAARRFEQAVTLKENDFQIWGNLAATYDVLNDSRARQAYRRAAALAQQSLQVNPKQEEIHSRLAFYCAGAGDRVAAEFWLAKAALRQTTDAVELAQNAATCERLGQREQALHWLEKASEQGVTRGELAEFQWLSALINDSRLHMPVGPD